MIVIGLLIFTLLPVYVSDAQDVTFEAAVDKSRMSFDDVLVLSFALSGGNLDLNVTPELPDLKDNFDILRGPSRSTSISIMNGRQSSSLTLQYILSPKKTGSLTIGPAILRYGQHTYTTNPITVEVVKTAQPQTPSQTPPSGAPDQDEDAAQPEVFLRGEADKTTAYTGEQITLSYYLYTRVNIAGYEFSQQPGFTGFWVEELSTPKPALHYQTLNGVRYGVALMKKTALFPASSGSLTIDPMIMTFSVRVQSRSRDPFDRFFDDPFDMFGRTQEIIRKTQPIELTILPLPEEGRPEMFNGDVGSFTMAVEVDKTQVKQGEPVTLTITIQGIGNIKTVKEPQITLPETFKRYDPEISENPFTLQEPLQGEKSFTSVIIPSTEGEFQFDPVQFSYFDPQRKTYQTIRSEPISLIILPPAKTEEPLERRIATKEEIKLLGQDIRFIKTDMSQIRDQSRYLYQTLLFPALLVVPALVLIGAYGYKQYQEKYRRDERYIRQKQAKKRSKQRFKTAADLMKGGDSKAFYAAISQTLRQYLGDKLNLPPAGITAEEICQALKQYGLDEETAGLLKHCLDECDFARFAPVADTTGMETILQKAETIVERVERLKIQKSKPRKQGLKTILLLVLPAACCLLPAAYCLLPSTAFCTSNLSAEDIFRQANELYEQGQYEEAITRYQAIVDSGIQNGAVYYNLGNALLKQQRIGEAILVYERAKRLLPRDDDVAFNLDYARAFTLDKMEQWGSGAIIRVLVGIRNFFTPDEVSGCFLAMYILLIFLVILFLFASSRGRTRILYLAILPIVCFLLSGILLFAQVSYLGSEQEAILLAPKSEARTGPGEGYSTVFEIHEGAKVRIQREKLEWVEIQLPNKVIGWMRKKDLAQIYQHP